jgi:hypothetical protein
LPTNISNTTDGDDIQTDHSAVIDHSKFSSFEFLIPPQEGKNGLTANGENQSGQQLWCAVC